MANQFAYYSGKKLHQDMRTSGNPNVASRKEFGFKEIYPQITSEFPVFDIRSALACLYYWKKDWPLEMRLEITQRIHKYVIQDTVDNKGIPQYIYAKQMAGGIYDSTMMLYCGWPKNYMLDKQHLPEVEWHFASPFGVSQGYPIGMSDIRSAQIAFYQWLKEDFSYTHRNVNGEEIDLKSVEPERRQFIIDRLPMIWNHVAAVIDDEYDEEKSMTWALRAYLAELDSRGLMSSDIDHSLVNAQLNQLNGSAFGRAGYIRTDGKNWFSNFYPFEQPMQDPDFENVHYKFPEHYYQAMKFTTFKNRSIISNCATPALAKRRGNELSLERENWNVVKYDYVKEAIAWKYQLGTKHAANLIASGRMLITEYNWWHDNDFGHCTCDRCFNQDEEPLNHLGEIHMDQREHLFEQLSA